MPERTFFVTFLYTISNSPITEKSQTSTNTSDRGEKWHEAWIIVEGSRSRKFDFSDIYATIVTEAYSGTLSRRKFRRLKAI